MVRHLSGEHFIQQAKIYSSYKHQQHTGSIFYTLIMLVVWCVCAKVSVDCIKMSQVIYNVNVAFCPAFINSVQFYDNSNFLILTNGSP